MTINCNNIKLSKGSTGSNVTEVQTILKNKGYYTGKVDGSYGDMTVSAVKSFQKANGLAVDGWVGPVTCKKLNGTNTNTNTTTTTYSYYKNGIYHSGQHYVGKGCDKMGQCTSYFCADCSMKQQLTKNDLDKMFTQSILAGYAGTTTSGTSHNGINTALATVAKKLGIKLKVEWKNFSDLGSTQRERFEALGKLISQQNVMIILHTLYQYRYGHYESIQEVNMNNQTCTMLNSLGSKCTSKAFCGYIETRNWSRLAKELAGISQKSVCIITYN